MKTTKIDEHAFDAFAENGVKIGQILREVDGFFVFYPEQHGGFWPAHMLREVSNKLYELNEPWEKQINDYFDAQTKS